MGRSCHEFAERNSREKAQKAQKKRLLKASLSLERVKAVGVLPNLELVVIELHQ
jgi:hypothetical protein